jgi:hypothetical protein
MDNIPDYSTYTLEELNEAYHTVEKEKYPDNFKAIIDEIKKRKIELAKEETNGITFNSNNQEVLLKLFSPQKPLPVIEIIIHTLSIFWKSKTSIIAALIIPYIVMGLIEILQPYIVIKMGRLMGFALTLLSSLVYALFAVSCHRIILLGSSAIPKFGLIIPSMREIRFFCWGVGIAIIIFIVTFVMIIPLSFMKFIPKSILVILILLPIFYVMARFTLIFPAVAVDQHPSLNWAWDRSRDNGWRLFVILFIPSASIFIMNHFTADQSSILLNGFITLLTFLFTVFGIILLSLSYKELCLEENHSALDSASSAE